MANKLTHSLTYRHSTLYISTCTDKTNVNTFVYLETNITMTRYTTMHVTIKYTTNYPVKIYHKNKNDPLFENTRCSAIYYYIIKSMMLRPRGQTGLPRPRQVGLRLQHLASAWPRTC